MLSRLNHSVRHSACLSLVIPSRSRQNRALAIALSSFFARLAGVGGGGQ